MFDTFVSKYTRAIATEINKKIRQICTEIPQIAQEHEHEHVGLWEQSTFYLDGELINRYSLTLDGKEIASFNVALERDQFGKLCIKASSDVAYTKN